MVEDLCAPGDEVLLPLYLKLLMMFLSRILVPACLLMANKLVLIGEKERLRSSVACSALKKRFGEIPIALLETPSFLACRLRPR